MSAFVTSDSRREYTVASSYDFLLETNTKMVLSEPN